MCVFFTLFFLSGIFTINLSAQNSETPATVKTVKNNEAPLFINLTSNQAHRVIYALKMGLDAINQGHPVIVFLNVDGVRVGLKSGLAHHPTTYGSATEMLQKILNKGGQVWVCPPCLKDAGFSKADLIDGATLYNDKLLENRFFVADLKTLSY